MGQFDLTQGGLGRPRGTFGMMVASRKFLSPIVAGIGLFTFVFTSASPKTNSSKIKAEMKVGEKMSEDIFGIQPEEYFANPLKNFGQIGFRFEDEGFNGLALGGPRYIPVQSDGKFPIAVMNVTESLDASLHLVDDYVIITAMDLSTGKLYAGMAVEQKYVKPKREPLKIPPPPGRSSDGCAADLFLRLKIPRSIGEYLISAILLDRISNRNRVKVGPAELAGHEERFLAALEKSKKASF